MVPYQVMMIPRFLLFRELGWIDTLLPLFVPAFFGGGAFNIFLLRQFFRTIPQATLDAARIDGCGYFATFWHVVLPMSKPALATVAIFTFMGTWNDYLAPLVYLNTKDNYTLSLGLALFRTRAEMVDITLLMAASLVVLLPCIIVFFICQRLFIQGVVVTGVK
jgi:ABC-type glycerol-3-phosphate transport system permease component